MRHVRENYFGLLYLLLSLCYESDGVVREYTVEEQTLGIAREYSRCLSLIDSATAATNNTRAGLDCQVDFDQFACWPSTPANHTAYISCPSYLNFFDSEEIASRVCGSNGTWKVSESNKSVGNYYHCYKNAYLIRQRKLEMYDLIPKKFIDIDDTMVKHMSHITKIYAVGNAVSITALVAAITLFIILRKLLASSRNIIHLNLFISFVLRGVCTLIHYFLTASEDADVDQSYKYNQEFDDFHIITKGSVGCKLNTVVWMFTRLSNIVWIFMEALYLHLLLFVITFNDRQHIKRFIALGWSVPLIFIIPWVITRAAVDDYRCWATYSFKYGNLRWIVEVPVVIILLVNFGFFINFIRLLSSKLKASQANGFTERVNRRLAKSSFILIPLFGVHYITFLFTDLYPNIAENTTLELFGIYFDTIFTSFQGVAVAILFCFCNSEVIAELQKKWIRLKTQSGMLLNQSRYRRSRPTQRTSLSSDTGVTYTARRHSSNGLLSISLTSDRRPSLRREISVPIVIDEQEEQSKLLTTEMKVQNQTELSTFST